MPRQAGYCSAQGSQQDETVYDSPPLAACIAPSSNMTASQHGGSFLVRSNFMSPCTVTGVSLTKGYCLQVLGSKQEQ